MEQRHREITDVVGGQSKPLDQAGPAHDAHRVSEPDCLRITAGTGGEDDHHRFDAADLHGHQWFRDRHRVLKGGTVDIKDPHPGHCETVEQAAVLRIDKQDLTVGSADVGHQTLPAPGGIDTAQDVPAQRRRCHGTQHRRRVAQQHTDMQRTVASHQPKQKRGLRGCLSEMLAPRPRPVAVRHRDTVVCHAGPQQLLDGFERHYQPLSLV
jgi:hypothetical protein